MTIIINSIKYSYENDEIVNENLKRLNEKMPKDFQFKARVRHFPHLTVDALLHCDSLEKAVLLKMHLEMEGEIMQFNGKDEIYLCIPAINVDAVMNTTSKEPSKQCKQLI